MLIGRRTMRWALIGQRARRLGSDWPVGSAGAAVQCRDGEQRGEEWPGAAVERSRDQQLREAGEQQLREAGEQQRRGVAGER